MTTIPTPLTSLLGQAQLLQRSLARAGGGDKDLSKANGIITGAKRMNAMIQDLVDSARIEGGQIKLDLHPVQLAPFFLGKHEVTQAQWYQIQYREPAAKHRGSPPPQRLPAYPQKYV